MKQKTLARSAQGEGYRDILMYNCSHRPECLWNKKVVTVVPAIHPDDAHHMEKVCSMGKINHYKEVCRSGKNKNMHCIDQILDQCQNEDDTEVLNISSLNFNHKCSVITANLKTLSNHAKVVVPYKVNTGSHRNIMPLHICEKLFPGATKEKLVATKSENISLMLYNTLEVQKGYY